MAYFIAIATSDGEQVDRKFGETDSFHIYSVEEKEIVLSAIRKAEGSDAPSQNASKEADASSCGKTEDPGCGSGCGGNSQACGGNGQGCGGGGTVLGKVTLIEDCRCVVAKKVGFQAQKQFEKKAISVFDVECSVKEALEKITSYYYKIDHRQSLRTKDVE
ncbi:MAG: hypothetical protein IKG93_07835 [Clostridiales bacterium]|nr:hypothetical protein [Clostridiales bacterium]